MFVAPSGNFRAAGCGGVGHLPQERGAVCLQLPLGSQTCTPSVEL